MYKASEFFVSFPKTYKKVLGLALTSPRFIWLGARFYMVGVYFIVGMAEALPHSLGSFQPTTKPTFPGGMLELEITPEKVWNKDCRKPAVKECKKRVAFFEDVNRVYAEKQVIDNKSKGLQSEHQQYPR